MLRFMTLALGGVIVSAATLFGSQMVSPLTEGISGSATTRTLSAYSPVSFRSGSRALAMLGAGFGAAEPDGTWVTEDKAVVHFEVATQHESFNLELQVFPFTAGTERSLSFAVSANNLRSTIDISEGLQYVTVPTDGFHRQVLTIECPVRVSPAAVGLSGDQRRLCFKLISLELQPTQPHSDGVRNG